MSKPTAVTAASADMIDSDTMLDILLIVGASVGAYFLYEYFSSEKPSGGGDDGNGGTLEPLSPSTKRPNGGTLEPLGPANGKRPPTVVSQPISTQGPWSAPGVTYCAKTKVDPATAEHPAQAEDFDPPLVLHSNESCNPTGVYSIAFEGQWMNGQWTNGKFIDPQHLCPGLMTNGGRVACDANTVTHPWPSGN